MARDICSIHSIGRLFCLSLRSPQGTLAQSHREHAPSQLDGAVELRSICPDIQSQEAPPGGFPPLVDEVVDHARNACDNSIKPVTDLGAVVASNTSPEPECGNCNKFSACSSSGSKLRRATSSVLITESLNPIEEPKAVSHGFADQRKSTCSATTAPSNRHFVARQEAQPVFPTEAKDEIIAKGRQEKAPMNGRRDASSRLSSYAPGCQSENIPTQSDDLIPYINRSKGLTSSLVDRRNGLSQMEFDGAKILGCGETSVTSGKKALDSYTHQQAIAEPSTCTDKQGSMRKTSDELRMLYLPPTLRNTASSLGLEPDDTSQSLQHLKLQITSPRLGLRDGNLYYGVSDEVKIPAIISREDVFERLSKDLQLAVRKIQRRKISRSEDMNDRNVYYELRMSGRKSREGLNIILRPCVWILCGSKWCQKLIQGVAKDITWLSQYGMSGIEVLIGAPQTSASSEHSDQPMAKPPYMLPFKDNCGYTVSESLQVFIHVDMSKMESHWSACGMSFISSVKREGQLSHQTKCRVGGLLLLNGTSLMGVTVAHGIASGWLDMLLQPSDDSSDADDNSSDVSYLTDSDFEDTPASPDDHTPACDFEDVTSMVNVSSDICGNFLGFDFKDKRFIDNADKKYRGTNLACYAPGAPDFALYSVDPLTRCIPDVPENSYQDCDSQICQIDSLLAGRDLVEGPVLVILGARKTVKAKLLSGSHHFSLQGQYIQTVKIQLSEPLGKGCSGAWVVRQRALCGMVLATFPHELFALIISTEKLISDIKTFIPGIETIELPRRSLPIIEYPHHDLANDIRAFLKDHRGQRLFENALDASLLRSTSTEQSTIADNTTSDVLTSEDEYGLFQRDSPASSVKSSAESMNISKVGDMSTQPTLPPKHAPQPNFVQFFGDTREVTAKSSTLVCDFRCLTGCAQEFELNEVHEWIEHISGHLEGTYPDKCVCWFCDDFAFDADKIGIDRGYNFELRLLHIRDHIIDEDAKADQMRPDFFLIKHLEDSRLIDHATYERVLQYSEGPSLPELQPADWEPQELIIQREKMVMQRLDVYREKRTIKKQQAHTNQGYSPESLDRGAGSANVVGSQEQHDLDQGHRPSRNRRNRNKKTFIDQGVKELENATSTKPLNSPSHFNKTEHTKTMQPTLPYDDVPDARLSTGTNGAFSENRSGETTKAHTENYVFEWDYRDPVATTGSKRVTERKSRKGNVIVVVNHHKRRFEGDAPSTVQNVLSSPS